MGPGFVFYLSINSSNIETVIPFSINAKKEKFVKKVSSLRNFPESTPVVDENTIQHYEVKGSDDAIGVLQHLERNKAKDPSLHEIKKLMKENLLEWNVLFKNHSKSDQTPIVILLNRLMVLK